MDFKQITIVKRKVKHPRLELKTGFPTLILPQDGGFNPTAIIKKHQKWLEQKIEFIENLKNKYKNQKIFQRKESNLIELTIKFIKEFSEIFKIEPKRVSFRYMKTKWGSCSKKRKISLNFMLKHLPMPLIRYVVFHEMIHLIVPNHSENFWLHIKKEFKNPKQYEEMLYGYWFLINSSKNQKNSSKAF